MSDMQRLDGSSGDTNEEHYKFQAPPVSVCEPAQVQHRRDSNWPFLYSYEGGRCFVNAAPRKSKYQEACAAGVALI
jgi:hypothetical protein